MDLRFVGRQVLSLALGLVATVVAGLLIASALPLIAILILRFV